VCDGDGPQYGLAMPPVPVRKTYFMLLVADMDRAVSFYTEVFAATLTLHTPYWSELVVAEATVALHPGRAAGELETGLGFEVDDLESVLELAMSQGGRISQPAQDRPNEGIRIAQLADTEGNIFSVAQPAR
jgi:predicted enzyme related to lactoylglutathione lyase